MLVMMMMMMVARRALEEDSQASRFWGKKYTDTNAPLAPTLADGAGMFVSIVLDVVVHGSEEVV